jgi:hypothetical protein
MQAVLRFIPLPTAVLAMGKLAVALFVRRFFITTVLWHLCEHITANPFSRSARWHSIKFGEIMNLLL